MKKLERFLALLMVGILMLGVQPIGFASDAGRPTVKDVEKLNSNNQGLVDEAVAQEMVAKALEDSKKMQTISEEHEKLSLLALPNDSGFTIQAIPTVQVGTDTTFYSADEGKNDSSSYGFGNATTSYVLSNNQENVGAWSIGIGTASGWAWVGKRFNVGGSNSAPAYIRMSGWYSGDLLGSFTGSAHVKIMMKVYDATTGSYIGQQTIEERTSTTNSPIVLDSTFNNSVYVSLQPGHQYVVYVITYGDVSQYGPNGSILEFGDNDDYTKWYSITVDWI